MIVYRLDNPDPRIPENLRTTYAHLVGGALELLRVLRELEVLFGASSKTIKLLNKAAPDFFMHHRELLTDQIILSVSRLTDNRWSGPGKSQENLTLICLLDLDGLEYQALRTDLEKKWTAIKTDAEPIRLVRHKVLAHADRGYQLSPSTELTDGVTFKLIKDVTNQINDYLVTFESFFTTVDTPLQPPATYGDASDLLTYLELGVDAEKKQEEEAWRAASIP
jgi:hypothetical protein